MHNAHFCLTPLNKGLPTTGVLTSTVTAAAALMACIYLSSVSGVSRKPPSSARQPPSFATRSTEHLLHTAISKIGIRDVLLGHLADF